MPCSGVPHPSTPPGKRSDAAIFPEDPTNQQGPWLIVSNTPELLGDVHPGGQSGTLYKCGLNLPAGSTTIRLFLWHINKFSEPVDLSALIHSSGKGTVSGFRQYVAQVPENSDFSIPGICIADMHLHATIDQASGQLNLTPVEQSLFSLPCSSNYLTALIMEFTVTITSPNTVDIRTTFAKQGASLPPYSDDPVLPIGNNGQTHIRGWWPFSEIWLHASGTLNLDANLPCDDANPGTVTCTICQRTSPSDPTPPELKVNVGFGKTPSDPFGTPNGNQGLYGANLHYTFSVHNVSNQQQSMLVYLLPRNVGVTWGAGNIVVPAGFPNGKNAKMYYNQRVYNDYTNGAAYMVSTGPELLVDCTFANGGGSALPAVFQVVRVCPAPP